MMCIRFIKSAASIKNRNELLTRCVTRVINSNNNRTGMSFSAKKSTEPDEDEFDEPIKYSTSKAAKVRVQKTRLPGSEGVMECEGLVVSFSLAVFLIYFCILREENDIDKMLQMPVEFLESPKNTAAQNVEQQANKS